MNEKTKIDGAIEKLKAAGVILNDEAMVGCDTKEIDKIEITLKIKLPISYKHFLTKMGKISGEFLMGSDFHYENLLALKKDAMQLLLENKNPFVLSDSDFVFVMHQGYQFLFFDTNEDFMDPPVYIYIESEAKVQVASSFSEWFEQTCNDEIKAYNDITK